MNNQEYTFQDEGKQGIQGNHCHRWQRVLNNSSYLFIPVNQLPQPWHRFLDFLVTKQACQSRDRKEPKEQQNGHAAHNNEITHPNR
jgi:hypothetical protein